MKVSNSVLWFVHPMSSSLPLGVEIKTKLDVLGSAVKWPTPVTDRGRRH